MSKRPWMPLYVADYVVDTRHLTGAEHGAYLLLMVHYWATGGLPTDDFRLQAIALMNDEQWARSKPIIQSLFDENWRHKRIDEELEHVRKVSKSRKTAGKKGGKKRSKSKANAIANDKQLPTHSHSHSHKEKYKKEDEGKTGAPRPVAEEKFEEFWKAYPKREPANPKTPARQAFFKILKAGVDPAEIVSGARGYAAAAEKDIGTKFIAMAVTWLNQERWKDYSAPPKNIIPEEELERLRARYREKQEAAL